MKEEFLRQLELELRFYLSNQECQAVIEDYVEYFDSAMDEGKREEEVCGQLGDVKKLAREIIMSGKATKYARLRDIASKINCAFENTVLANVISLLPLAAGAVL